MQKNFPAPLRVFLSKIVWTKLILVKLHILTLVRFEIAAWTSKDFVPLALASPLERMLSQPGDTWFSPSLQMQTLKKTTKKNPAGNFFKFFSPFLTTELFQDHLVPPVPAVHSLTNVIWISAQLLVNCDNSGAFIFTWMGRGGWYTLTNCLFWNQDKSWKISVHKNVAIET